MGVFDGSLRKCVMIFTFLLFFCGFLKGQVVLIALVL